MRILIVTETYPPNINGAALATERLAEELAKHGHHVAVIAPSTAFKHYKSIDGNLTVYRVRSIIIQKNQKFRVSPQPLHAKEFKEIVREVQPDIMHINNPGFLAQTAMSIAKQINIPIIGTSHFMPENITHYLHLPDQLEKFLNTSIWKIYTRFYSRLNLVISPTQTAADLLTKLGVGTQVQVISNGIDLKKFNKNNNGEYLKERYKLPNKTTFLFVGRLDKEKCIDVLIKAVALIKNKADFHVVIAGKGKEEVYLKELASELEVDSLITFTGYLPKKDVTFIYKLDDIFVMPSIAELKSLLTMEDMAKGLPVLGADAVALPHLIKDKRNGFLFQPYDEKKLASRMLTLANDKALVAKMSDASQEIIQAHDMDQVVHKVEKAYESVIREYKAKVPEKKLLKRDVLRSHIKKLMPQHTGNLTK